MEPKIEPRKFRKKPVVVEAARWFKNGDHPEDYDHNVQGFERGQPHQWSGVEARELGWEGQIVRYFRRPDVSGETLCRHCSQIMHIHGWIDTKEGGHIVCPGDWIITGVQGEHYPCKPDIFAATYESEYAPSSPAAPTPHMNAPEFYREVWIKENGSDPRGDWPIRMAEAYAAYQTARADRAEQERDKAHAFGMQSHSEWLLFLDAKDGLTPEIIAEKYTRWFNAQPRLQAAEADLQRKDAALREMLEVKFPKKCVHNADPWYCDSCKYGWEKAIAAAMEKIAASL